MLELKYHMVISPYKATLGRTDIFKVETAIVEADAILICSNKDDSLRVEVPYDESFDKLFADRNTIRSKVFVFGKTLHMNDIFIGVEITGFAPYFDW